MVTSINASSLNLNASNYQVGSYNTTVDKSQEQEETKKTSSMMTKKLKEEESETSSNNIVTETSKEGDTLSLSQEGLNMSLSSKAAPTTSGATSSSSSSDSSDLSGYTETQLKSMLDNGEISQAEYNQEIKSRATEDTEVTDTTTQSLKNDQTLVSQLNILV